jgi:hypothetical protein
MASNAGFSFRATDSANTKSRVQRAALSRFRRFVGLKQSRLVIFCQKASDTFSDGAFEQPFGFSRTFSFWERSLLQLGVKRQ